MEEVDDSRHPYGPHSSSSKPVGLLAFIASLLSVVSLYIFFAAGIAIALYFIWKKFKIPGLIVVGLLVALSTYTGNVINLVVWFLVASLCWLPYIIVRFIAKVSGVS